MPKRRTLEEINVKEKVCVTCKELKPVAMYYAANKHGDLYYYNKCMVCTRASYREMYRTRGSRPPRKEREMKFKGVGKGYFEIVKESLERKLARPMTDKEVIDHINKSIYIV
jgi:hypothetical protein